MAYVLVCPNKKHDIRSYFGVSRRKVNSDSSITSALPKVIIINTKKKLLKNEELSP